MIMLQHAIKSQVQLHTSRGPRYRGDRLLQLFYMLYEVLNYCVSHDNDIAISHLTHRQ